MTNKLSYSQKEELIEKAILVKIVDLITTGNYKNSKEIVSTAETYFKAEYAAGNTYKKLITSYQITDALARFCLDLPDFKDYFVNKALEKIELNNNVNEQLEIMPGKDMSKVDELQAKRKKIFPKVFKHFSNKEGMEYEEAIKATIEYCKDKNPEGVADGNLYPETVKVVLADVFYETLLMMKTDPAKIVRALIKKLSKEDLQQVQKDVQAHLAN